MTLLNHQLSASWLRQSLTGKMWRVTGMALLLWALLAWGLTGAIVKFSAGKVVQHAQEDLSATSQQLVGNIHRIVNLLYGIPTIAGKEEKLRQALHRFVDASQAERGPKEEIQRRWHQDEQLQEINRWLAAVNNTLGATSVLWVMNTVGDTIAASNSDKIESFIGTNFVDREYFQAAKTGGRGSQYAVGRVSNLPGLYFSVSVKEGERFLGVIAVKVDLSFVGSWIDQSEALFSDRYGVIFFAKDKRLEMHALPDNKLELLSEEARLKRYKQANIPLLAIAPWPGTVATGLHKLALNDSPPFLWQSASLPAKELTLTVIKPVAKVQSMARERLFWFALSQALGLLIAIFALARLMMRRQQQQDAQALQSSEARLATIFRSSPIGIAIISLRDHRLIEINDALANFAGYSRQTLLGQSLGDLAIWPEKEAQTHLFLPLGAGKPVPHWESPLHPANGEPLACLWSADPITVEDEPCCLVMVLDISSRKHLEESLLESKLLLEQTVALRTGELSHSLQQLQEEMQERLRLEEKATRAYQEQVAMSNLLRVALESHTLHNQLQTALQIMLSLPWLNLLDKGIILLANERGQSLRPFVTWEIAEWSENACNQCQQQSCPFQFSNATMAYQFFRAEVLCSASPCATIHVPTHLLLPLLFQEELLGVIKLFPLAGKQVGEHELSLLTDMARILAGIVSRNRTEERNRLAAKVFANTQEAILITDRHNKIIDVNPAFSHITLYSRQEALGQDPGFVKSDRHDRGFYSHMWLSLLKKGNWQGEIWDRRKDGTFYPKWLTIDTIRDDKGEISHCIGIFNDISERKLAEDQLRQMAMTDTLTGLPNRNHFLPVLEQAVKNASRNNRPLALLMFDLDRFKKVNDTLGHPAGDLLLQQVAQRVRSCLRQSDMVARLGGDEFAVIAEQQAGWRETANIAQKIVDQLAKPFDLSGEQARIAASVGIAFYPTDAADDRELLRKADTASYHAKQRGGNSFHFFSPEMEQGVAQRAQLELALLQDLQDGQFELYYQPQVNPANQRIEGVEALLRRRLSDGSLALPSQFIAVAEESGLIIPLGEWVLQTACRQGKAWLDAGMYLSKLAVNVSGRQFDHKNFPDTVADILQQSAFPAHKLELELTESYLIREINSAHKVIEALRRLGVRIVLDDFGTEYSSFGYIKHIPIDGIKLPREYSADCTNNPFRASVAWAMMAMAGELGIHVVVEGLELEEEASFFRGLSAELVQGYYFAPPMPAAEVEALLQQ